MIPLSYFGLINDTNMNQNEFQPGSEDELRAENELLKLKLEIDHGMQGFGSRLGPKAENEWLKSVFEFENMLKESRDLTIYDLIGRPPIKRWYAIKKGSAGNELNKILTLLEKNGISIHNLDAADESAFYRAITEELLPTKLGNLGKGPFMPPMITWFGKEDSKSG